MFDGFKVFCIITKPKQSDFNGQFPIYELAYFQAIILRGDVISNLYKYTSEDNPSEDINFPDTIVSEPFYADHTAQHNMLIMIFITILFFLIIVQNIRSK